jgi:hypothetical protein
MRVHDGGEPGDYPGRSSRHQEDTTQVKFPSGDLFRLTNRY